MVNRTVLVKAAQIKLANKDCISLREPEGIFNLYMVIIMEIILINNA